jgi:hypothetical protein
MLGFHSKEEAEIAYRAAYDDGASDPSTRAGDRVADIKELAMNELRRLADLRVAEKSAHEMRVRFPVKANKGVTYESGKPYIDFLVSGTKLDRTAYVDEQGRQVVGEKIAPILLDKMLEQANGQLIPQQQAAGGIYFIESHDATIPMGWVVSAVREDLPSGDWQLHAKVQLDPQHPLVPVLIRNVESGKYVPDCSVGLKVIKGTAWDEEEGGYVGYLFDGFWEHLAMTKPGHPAYPDAELEGVFLAKNFMAAASGVYQSVAKDVDWANKHKKAEPANEAVTKGESPMDPVKVTGAGLVAKNKEAEAEAEAGKAKEAEAGKTKEAEANNKAAADAAAESARKRKEAEMAAETEAEAEQKRKSGKTGGAEAPASMVAEAGKDAAFPPPKPPVPPAGAPTSGPKGPLPAPPPTAPVRKEGGKNLADYMRNIHSTMKQGVEGESSPEDFKALMADIMDDFEEACEMADAMTGGSQHEAEAGKGKEAGAPTITHEPVAPVAKTKEEEAEMALKVKEDEACKTKEAAEELVTKSVTDRRTRRLLRKMNETITSLVTSNKAMTDKLANLDKKPASSGPLRYADASAASLRARASTGSGDSNLVEVIKSIEDPQKRDLVSRAVGQDILQAAIGMQFPALAEAQKEWDKEHGKA